MCPQSAEFWGCEFIDDGSYGSVVTLNIFSPWKINYPQAILFPKSFLLKISDKKYADEIRKKETSYIEELKNDIKINGLKEPLTIVYDKAFKIRLQDGNHRLIALSLLSNYTEIPVVFELVKKITAPGLNIEALLPTLVLEHARKNPAQVAPVTQTS